MEQTPIPTLYLRNLNDKIKLEGIIPHNPEELKKSVYMLCSVHGEVLEVHMQHSAKLRGQAFVVFREVEMAQRALIALQGFPLFGKPMVFILLTRWANRPRNLQSK